jgi:hypothetical protein
LTISHIDDGHKTLEEVNEKIHCMSFQRRTEIT